MLAQKWFTYEFVPIQTHMHKTINLTLEAFWNLTSTEIIML